MADSFDLNTLIPAEKLQYYAQLFGSPMFSAKGSQVNDTEADRVWYIHFFTGRVPTAAEHYFGVYVDRIGDTHKSQAVSLNDRYMGYITVNTKADNGSNTYAVDKDMKANGADADGIVLGSPHSGFTAVERSADADLSWMMDWSFRAGVNKNLSQGNLSELMSWAQADVLAGEDRPTWFMVTASVLPTFGKTPVIHPTSNAATARLDVFPKTAGPESLPLVTGTVGDVGSGADLELAVGGDHLDQKVAPVALRVHCSPTTPSA